MDRSFHDKTAQILWKLHKLWDEKEPICGNEEIELDRAGGLTMSFSRLLFVL
jgi:hypothetical protein